MKTYQARLELKQKYICERNSHVLLWQVRLRLFPGSCKRRTCKSRNTWLGVYTLRSDIPYLPWHVLKFEARWRRLAIGPSLRGFERMTSNHVALGGLTGYGSGRVGARVRSLRARTVEWMRTVAMPASMHHRGAADGESSGCPGSGCPRKT
jgi:hypothetical protein